MKKVRLIVPFVLLLALLLTACGSSAPQQTDPPYMDYLLGDTRVTVTLPTELGFAQKESEFNKFFGTGANGEWSIIVNYDEKGDYTLEEYSNLTAQANGADQAYKDSEGNYYFIYDNGEYRSYAAVREDATYYYRVTFYCFADVWSSYRDQFDQWAATIQIG